MKGKRVRHMFPTLKAAKKAAKKKADELDQGNHGAASLRAIALLQSSGTPLEFAASECASAIKRLGAVSLSQAVDFYLSRHPVPVPLVKRRCAAEGMFVQMRGRFFEPQRTQRSQRQQELDPL